MCIEDQKQSHGEGNALLAKMKADCGLVIILSRQVMKFVPFRLTCLLFELLVMGKGLDDALGCQSEDWMN